MEPSLKILIAFGIVVCVSGGQVKYKDCGSEVGTIHSVSIDPCKEPPCKFQKNTNVQVMVNFTSKADSETAWVVVQGIINNIPVVAPTSDPNACDYGVKCPVKAGGTYMYSYGIYVEDDFPSIGMDIRWEIKDDIADDMVCFQLPIVITDG